MSEPLEKRVYVDSNVLIYAVEGVATTADPAKKLIKYLRAHRGLMFTSEIALAEVLAPSRGLDSWPLHLKRRAYLDLLIYSGTVTLLPVTRDILIRTADLRKTIYLKLPDAVHLMSAIQSECRFIVTADADLRKLPPGLKHVPPDEQGIDSLLRQLA